MGALGFANYVYTAGTVSAKGLETGSRTATLETTPQNLYSVFHYDIKGRNIRSVSSNYMSGFEDVTTTYGYTNQPLKVTHIHSIPSMWYMVETLTYTYDQADRVKTVTHRLANNTAVTLKDNTYDNYGRLHTSNLMNCETVTYSYNIRNWLTGISSTNFSESLFYYNSPNPCFNGNISRLAWQQASTSTTRGYDFVYDNMNRLTSATYGESESLQTNKNRYNTSCSYDKNGNILTLTRKGLQDGGSYGFNDNLSFTYTGNQVTKVEDAANDPTYYNAFNFKDGASQENEYTYDKNGNMTKDLNKNISSIQYNSLNLPANISSGNSIIVSYTYSTSGEKLFAHYNYGPAGAGYMYCGNFKYVNNTLKEIRTDGGYITFSGSTPVYHYYLKDHLGSNRVVCSASGSVDQVNHYYPFGGLFGESTGGDTQRYKYNDKVFDQTRGINWYDYGARFMCPDVGRFITMDPMAEKYYSVSPYAYCDNNPINAIDPNGMDWVLREYNGIKEFYYDRNIRSQKDINRIYGANSGINYIQNNSSFELGGTSYTFYNDNDDNKYGYVTKKGKKLDNSNILYGDDFTIFGTTDNSVDAQTLHNNIFRTSYTGSNNPKDYNGNESYQYKPRNKSEYGSYIHDILYSRAKARGANDAFLNFTPKVVAADQFLVYYNYYNMMSPNTPILDRGRSALTAALFSFIVGYKTIINLLDELK